MDMVIDKKCEMCGAQLEVSADRMKAVCPYCGSTYSYVKPITEDTATYINRANNYRMRNMFDNAIVEYKTLLMNKELKDNAELYWGLLLSEFGIEFVYDSRDDRYVPTCHRTLSGSIFDDANYKKAIELATDGMKAEYTEKAAEIDALQRSIKAQAEQVEDYDVFICFKSTDKKAATEDRYIARRIFDETTRRGFRTFFSEISLKGRLGSEYEPIIYKALTTAKVMILVATKEEYLNAPFVKNEWGRFLERKKSDPSLKLVPVFRDTDVSVLPTREQGIDLSKYPAGGYEIDIADNLERLFGRNNFQSVYMGQPYIYAQYGNKYSAENKYKNALRNVDISAKRRKDAGKEYADKAAAMESLGNYKNAQTLAKQYDELAEFYGKTEKKLFFKMRTINIVCTLIAAVFSVITVLLILNFEGVLENFDIESSVDMSPVTNLLTGMAVGVTLIVSLVYSLTMRKARFSLKAKRTELILYGFSVFFMLFTVVVYVEEESEGTAANILLLIVLSGIFIANLIKYLLYGRLPHPETAK